MINLKNGNLQNLLHATTNIKHGHQHISCKQMMTKLNMKW